MQTRGAVKAAAGAGAKEQAKAKAEAKAASPVAGCPLAPTPTENSEWTRNLTGGQFKKENSFLSSESLGCGARPWRSVSAGTARRRRLGPSIRGGDW